MTFRNLKAVVGSFALFAGLMSSTAANAGLLVGSATLNRADDLTVIKEGNDTYEFLDLQATMGRSHAEVLSRFGPVGFKVATSRELQWLFESFGFSYANKLRSHVALDVTDAQARQFTSYLYNGAMALGSFQDLDFGMSWSCVSMNSCNPTSFVANDDYSRGHPIVGVYLVREIAGPKAEVPEPGSFALIGLGVAGMMATRRRKKLAGE